MTEQQTTPELRFSEFKEEWKLENLGNLADIVRGASPRPIKDSKWFDDNSDIGWLRISDVTQQNGKIKFLQQHLSNEGQKKTRVLYEPHLLLSIAASVGKPVINYVKTGVHDGFLIFMRPKFNLYFMFNWLENFQLKWNKYGQPGSQVNLNSDLVKSQNIYIPKSYEEQEKMGIFFNKLDQHIELEKQKLALFEQQKKGYMQKIFSQELCFTKLSSSNTQKCLKIKDLFNIIDGDRGKNYPNEKDFYNQGYTLFLDTGNVTKKGFSFTKNRFINKEKDDLLRNGKLELNDFVITSRGTLGNIGFYSQDIHLQYSNMRINSAMLILRPIDKMFDYSYLYFLLRDDAINTFMKHYRVGSAQPHITKKDFGNMKINVTTDINEQKKIANFLERIDRLVINQGNKVETLKRRKQGLLQKMFV
ncbi:restriction endonuclease subunit S [Staphylococcus caprae]|uniref:restriction endonuclease subunit S n=1 Tax=Staphylococcus caprae TaxID=29380 RepID=UPI003B20FC8B